MARAGIYAPQRKPVEAAAAHPGILPPRQARDSAGQRSLLVTHDDKVDRITPALVMGGSTGAAQKACLSF